MGAHVTILDVNAHTMDYLEDVFGAAVETLYSNPANVEESVRRADLVIGAVLVPGAVAPKLVDDATIARMDRGSVIVDVAVDQGGCITTARPTSHDQPTYEVHGVIHYCVPNMPGAVAHTSTFALTNTTVRYALALADKGVERAVREDPALAQGVNCWDGACTYQAVASAHDIPFVPLATAMQ
jgi:alanine dehydrogenase